MRDYKGVEGSGGRAFNLALWASGTGHNEGAVGHAVRAAQGSSVSDDNERVQERTGERGLVSGVQEHPFRKPGWKLFAPVKTRADLERLCRLHSKVIVNKTTGELGIGLPVVICEDAHNGEAWYMETSSKLVA